MNSHSDLRAALDAKFKPPLPHVAVCIPAMDMLHTTFFTDFMQLMWHAKDYTKAFHPIVVRDTILQRSRTILANHAMKTRSTTHVLFMDTDMCFPPNALQRLLAHDKDIIGANYRLRQKEVNSVARSLDDKIMDSAKATGIEPVLHTGTGFLLIKRRVFEALEKPWFETTYRHGKDDWMGEDVYFCIMAKQAGFDIFVDHDLSKEIGHTGTFEFGWT